MSSIAIDTNILIYLSQPHSEFYPATSTLLANLLKKGCAIVCSSIAFAEYKTLSDMDILERAIDQLFYNGSIVELPFGHAEALCYADLKRAYPASVSSLDITHIATAQANGCQKFITNDSKLWKLSTKDLPICGIE